VKKLFFCFVWFALTTQLNAQINLIATSTFNSSKAGTFEDLSGLHYALENGVRADELGGLGSAIAYAGGNTFLALPDRGPNAVPFDSAIDDTVSYINRFHTISMDLQPNTSGTGLPFTLTPTLRQTTLLWSFTPLVYGSGSDLGVGSGVPPLNANGISAGNIPAKIEGIAFGPDVVSNGTKMHTLWVANDNDFLEMVPDTKNNLIPNPNQFFVFGFTDSVLGGSIFVPQQIRPLFGFDLR
jgi:hypothetical protein